MTIDRRTFVERSAGALVGLVLPGCASVVATRVAPSGGELRLPLADYPQLTRPDGFLRVQPVGAATPLYVLAVGEGRYVTVSPVCTHLGCTVDPAGDLLVCPCHGSTYDRLGAVLRGPAERPLRSYRTRTDEAGDLVIELEGGG